MKSSELNKFLNKTFTGAEFRVLIESEAVAYEKLMKKKGSSIPLIFYEDEQLLLNEASIKRMLQETLLGSLSNVDLAYICDCLTLGERIDYDSEEAKDLVFEIADPEINGGYKSSEELQRMIDNVNPE